MAMEDIRNENDEDRFEMFDLSMSIVSLLNYINKLKPIKKYFGDIDLLSSKVREDCRKAKFHLEKIKRRSRKLERENDLLRNYLEHTNAERQRYRRERDDMRDQMQRFRNHRKWLPANEYGLQDAEEELNQLRHDFERQAKEHAHTFKEFETTSNEIMGSQRQKIQHLERELGRRDMKINELKEMLYDGTTKTGKRPESQLNVREADEERSNLRYHLQQTLTKLDETEAELEETKTRLSKAMGDRLTDNNPNIADLSDKNRPTKLAERYNELYDNQWTDAFDFIDRYFRTEENTIETLLKILQDAMDFCKRKGREQMKDLLRVLEFSDIHEHKDVSSNVSKPLRDCRRSMSSFAVRNLYEMYVSYLRRSADQTLRTALDVGSFTKECIEICWLMVIQDPPIVFAPMVTKGSGFNTDQFKPYTSSGVLVDYVVWPALLLHKGGPVLAKGVAQGYGKKFRTNETSSNISATYTDKDKIQTKSWEKQFPGGDRHRDSSRGKDSKTSRPPKVERHRFEEEGKEIENPNWTEYAFETTRRYKHDGKTKRIPLGFDMANPDYNCINVNEWESFRNGIGQQAFERRHMVGNQTYY